MIDITKIALFITLIVASILAAVSFAFILFWNNSIPEIFEGVKPVSFYTSFSFVCLLMLISMITSAQDSIEKASLKGDKNVNNRN